MALRNNNNQHQPTSMVYTPIAFANPESENYPSRLTISYFNRLMKISISKKIGSSNEGYPKYDTDNEISSYLSFSKARILHKMIIDKLLNPKDKTTNVCVETTAGLLKVCDGSEYGVASPCIVICVADNSGNTSDIVYQTKIGNSYSGAYNYKDGKYSNYAYPEFELDTFIMVLSEYYKASSYAIAASVQESGMYKRSSLYSLIKSIATKVGAVESKGNYSSKSFLTSEGVREENDSSSHSNSTSDIPKEYEQSSFDDVARSLGIND